MPGVRIVGIGHYSPDNCISNDYLASIVDTSDEWIVKRTGIKTRNLSQGEGSSELGAKAALNALKKLRLQSRRNRLDNCCNNNTRFIYTFISM